jgi:hypothetical protein
MTVEIETAYKQMITPLDERILHLISQMSPHEKPYAHAWWQNSKHGGKQPEPGTYGLKDQQAESVRIKLAAVL